MCKHTRILTLLLLSWKHEGKTRKIYLNIVCKSHEVDCWFMGRSGIQPGGRNFLNPVVLANRALQHLPGGSSLNSLCEGCEGSAVMVMVPAEFLTLDL